MWHIYLISYLLCSTLNGKTMATCYTVDEFQKQCWVNNIGNIKTYILFYTFIWILFLNSNIFLPLLPLFLSDSSCLTQNLAERRVGTTKYLMNERLYDRSYNWRIGLGIFAVLTEFQNLVGWNNIYLTIPVGQKSIHG